MRKEGKARDEKKSGARNEGMKSKKEAGKKVKA